MRQPNGRDWEYNYFHTDFGRLSSGSYEVRLYISIEGSIWKYLDSKTFLVSGSAYASDNFQYDFTQIGHSFDYAAYEYYNVGYPYYVTFPLSESQR